jgi:mercuric ion transport protein
MEKDRWFKAGLVGTIVTAVCCATPLLPWVFGLLGLAAVTAYLDYVLVPLLLIFLAITLWAGWARRRTGSRS